MIGFISTDYLWATKINREHIRYFLMAETALSPFEARLVLPEIKYEDITHMDCLIPPTNICEHIERHENAGDFRACVGEYLNYLSDNGLFESLEVIINDSENDKKDIIFLCDYEDMLYLETLAIALNVRYGINVSGPKELCGRAKYFPDCIDTYKFETLSQSV